MLDLLTNQVDCRRTDRTLAIFAIPPEAVKQGAEKDVGGAGHDWDGYNEEEEGSSTRLNREFLGHGLICRLIFSPHRRASNCSDDISHIPTRARLCSR